MQKITTNQYLRRILSLKNHNSKTRKNKTNILLTNEEKEYFRTLIEFKKILLYHSKKSELICFSPIRNKKTIKKEIISNINIKNIAEYVYKIHRN